MSIVVQWFQTEVLAAYAAGALTLAFVLVGLLLGERRRTHRARQEARMVRAELDAVTANMREAVIALQKAAAATGLDSHAVMHLIAERSQRLTGASGVILETASGNAPAPRLHLGAVDASASVLTVDLTDNQQTLGVLKIVSKT